MSGSEMDAGVDAILTPYGDMYARHDTGFFLVAYYEEVLRQTSMTRLSTHISTWKIWANLRFLSLKQYAGPFE